MSELMYVLAYICVGVLVVAITVRIDPSTPEEPRFVHGLAVLGWPLVAAIMFAALALNALGWLANKLGGGE